MCQVMSSHHEFALHQMPNVKRAHLQPQKTNVRSLNSFQVSGISMLTWANCPPVKSRVYSVISLPFV